VNLRALGGVRMIGVGVTFNFFAIALPSFVFGSMPWTARLITRRAALQTSPLQLPHASRRDRACGGDTVSAALWRLSTQLRALINHMVANIHERVQRGLRLPDRMKRFQMPSARQFDPPHPLRTIR